MATNKKISDLTTRAFGSVTGDEVVPVAESGSNYGIASKNLAAKAAHASLTTYTGTSTAISGSEIVPIVSGTTNYKQTLAPLLKTKTNYIDNSDFSIWQRGTTVTGTATTAFTADRWSTKRSAGAYTVSQASISSDLVGIRNGAKVQRTASDADTSVLTFAQSLVAEHAHALTGQAVVLSFYAKKGANYSAASDILNVQLYTGTTANESINSGFTGSSTIINTTATLTTSLQRFVVTGTIGATAIQSLGVVFYYSPVGTAGADDSYTISGVKLEVGSLATPYESKGYVEELNVCKTYFDVLGGTAYEFFGAGGAQTTSQSVHRVPYSTKRGTPTITMVGTVGQHSLLDFGGGGVENAATVISYANIGRLGCGATVTGTGTPFTAGEAVMYLAGNNTSAKIYVSSEI